MAYTTGRSKGGLCSDKMDSVGSSLLSHDVDEMSDVFTMVSLSDEETSAVSGDSSLVPVFSCH